MIKMYSPVEFIQSFCHCEYTDHHAAQIVREICQNVKVQGSEAVRSYTREFDKVDIASADILVSEAEIKEAYSRVKEQWLCSLNKAIASIRSFHLQQREKTWLDFSEQGIIRGQLITPIQRVGLYVPGGTAAYPSSVLMGAIPPQVAGVEEIIITTPPDTQGLVAAETLVAASELGVEKIFKVGGAQAIAAMAYGTAEIDKVDKIVGPGNIYVTIAKKEVFGTVDIDMLAGPSEICIVADHTAKAEWVAADLLAQAEHDQLAQVVLITTDSELADKVQLEVSKQVKSLPRQAMATASLKNHGAIVLAENIAQALELANEFAPEHLELMVVNPFELLTSVKNAGSIFLGNYAAESFGDYIAGPNHVLPTAGSSRFFSALGVSDFYKRSGVLHYNYQAMSKVAQHVINLAESEGLKAHAEAVRRRIQNV